MEQGPEQVAVATTEMALLHQLQHLAQFRHGGDQFPGAIAPCVERRDFRFGVAKEEEVFGANLLADLHIGPIEGADREGPIHGELHVARAGGLLSSGGNLLG